MSDYTELVQRLREQYMDTKQMLPNVLCHDSADAITKLRAERDDAIRHLADWSSRCGRTEADLAAARARLDSVAERDRLAIAAVEGVQQMRIDLAAARAESDLAHWLLRNARKYMNPMHEALCAAIDNVLQKKQAALAGKDAT